jgi:hypothetical protein
VAEFCGRRFLKLAGVKNWRQTSWDRYKWQPMVKEAKIASAGKEECLLQFKYSPYEISTTLFPQQNKVEQ